MGTGRTLYYYWSKFNPARLTAGRQLRGLTKSALADRIGKSPSSITQFEAGTSGIDIQTFEAVVNVLNLPPSFFAIKDGVTLHLGTCHFRAKRDLSQLLRKQAIAYANIVLRILQALEEMGVQFPELLVEQQQAPEHFTLSAIENSAVQARKAWSLGLGPIDNMAQLLESKGIFVILLPDDYQGLDAFTDWASNERPYVMAVANSKPSRLQFDFGHELAHILFHRHIPTGSRETEQMANAFSGAFLMPAATFGKYCPTFWNINSFINVKKEWFVSIQAAMYRARELGKLSESAYRRGTIYLREKNLHILEPAEPDTSPYPTILSDALSLVKDEVTLEGLAEDIGLTSPQLEEVLLTQQVPQTLIDELKPRKHRATVLRLVPSSSSK